MLPAAGGPELLVELMDAENLSLFRHDPGEVLISPLILSHMMAQVALRPELRAVFDELFGPSGADVSFVPTSRYGTAGTDVRFVDLEERVAAHGDVALGVRLRPDEAGRAPTLLLNQPREQRWTLAADDEVVVLTTAG
jgi:hypothetical protein